MNRYHTNGSAVPEALGAALLSQGEGRDSGGNLPTLRKRGTMANNTSTTLTRRIGPTTYKVSVHFQENGNQTMADKILHMIQNKDLASESVCGKMNLPQMSRQSERNT